LLYTIAYVAPKISIFRVFSATAYATPAHSFFPTKLQPHLPTTIPCTSAHSVVIHTSLPLGSYKPFIFTNYTLERNGCIGINALHTQAIFTSTTHTSTLMVCLGTLIKTRSSNNALLLVLPQKPPQEPLAIPPSIPPPQGLSINFAFTDQALKDKTHSKTYKGINGETCYILIADHASTQLNGATRVSKGAPLTWLHNWLLQNSPGIAGQYIFLDQGGELYNNPKVCALFAQFGYDICPTGVDSSHQNGPIKRAHQMIGNTLRAILHGAHLKIKF
jgi:hypothetical protein